MLKKSSSVKLFLIPEPRLKAVPLMYKIILTTWQEFNHSSASFHETSSFNTTLMKLKCLLSLKETGLCIGWSRYQLIVSHVSFELLLLIEPWALYHGNQLLYVFETRANTKPTLFTELLKRMGSGGCRLVCLEPLFTPICWSKSNSSTLNGLHKLSL